LQWQTKGVQIAAKKSLKFPKNNQKTALPVTGVARKAVSSLYIVCGMIYCL